MKKLFIISIGLISGFIFELLNLSEFYSIFLPKNYVNANAPLFLLIGPLSFIILSFIFTIFTKKYNWMWLIVGFFSGFLVCFIGFMILLSLGGGV